MQISRCSGAISLATSIAFFNESVTIILPLLSIEALATTEVPAFEVNASISKEKFEKIFGGELEQALPDLIQKSGMKID